MHMASTELLITESECENENKKSEKTRGSDVDASVTATLAEPALK